MAHNNSKNYDKAKVVTQKEGTTNIYKGFSCPQEILDQEVLASIAIEHSKETVRNFLNQYSYLIDQYSIGLKEYIIGWLDKKEEKFDTVWDLAFGYILNKNINNENEVIQALVTLGLHLSLTNSPANWSVKLEEPVRLKCGGWLLPFCDQLKVSSLKQNLEIELICKNSKPEFIDFNKESYKPYQLPQIIYKDNKTIILPEIALRSTVFDDIRTEIDLTNSWEDSIKSFQEALEILDEHATIYYKWVKRVIKAVIPLHAPQSGIISGTNFTRPSVLEISLSWKHSIELAEILVHEATHQYMTILCRLGEIDDGSDTNLYYSPIRKSQRPIKAIVIAYHAIGNMLLFYRLCHKKGLNSVFAQSQESLLSFQVQELEQILKTTNSLTLIGKNLWEPLANYINTSSSENTLVIP